jgi:two-component sensor histidine kinase
MVKDVSGNPLYFLPMIEDINERKRMEDEIKASLKEKETLLREIHHRVKNNMQIINSLLSLQEGYIKDKESIELFRDTQNRVRSMAMVHEKLYQSKNLARINFAEYIYSLISEILSSYKVSPDIIKIKKDVKNLFFGIDTAIPLALITNELIINSLKHAFPNGRKGEISISIQSYNGKIILVISDNGAGIPLNIDFKNTDTLGLQLVNNLTEQLDGEIELERNNGTTFRITFPQIEKTET